MKRSIRTILLVLLYSGLAVSSVSAHAVLLRSNPQANAVLDKPPVQVELFFSESLEPTLSTINVIDSNNLSVDAGDVRVDPSDSKRMTVTMHLLQNGVYTVSWKALSAIDGHQAVGTFPFAVGAENATTVGDIQQSSTARLPFSALFSKFLILVSLAILLGERLFVWLIWNPALGSNLNDVRQPANWAAIYRMGLIGILIAIAIGILSQAGQTSGAELSFPWDLETGRILTDTRLGVIWLVRLGLVMLAVWLAGRNKAAWRDLFSFVVNLAFLFTVTLTSHAATDARPTIPILADTIHLLGMTFWLGGLIYLFTGIRHLQRLEARLRAQLTSLLSARFSVNAIIFVSLIGLTGFYSASLRVGSWSALLTSLYGHVLLVKQVFVVGLLVIAATNLLVISPRLKRYRLEGATDASIVSRFSRNLVLELTFAGMLLASVTFLTYLPPAKIVPISSDLTGSKKVDDLKMDIAISPGRIGQNTFKLIVKTSDGRPLHSAKEVLLRFTPIRGGLAPSDLELIGGGDGNFLAKGANLSLAGNWQVQAIVRREDAFDAYANFNFSLQQPGAGNESTVIPRQAGALLILIGLLCAILTISVHSTSGLFSGASVPLTILILVLGFIQFSQPTEIRGVQVNPIPPNSESVSEGETLYINNCASCHGKFGKGDGPVGLTLNPRPADLTQHAIPGVHTDAQLFEWITNGFPGSSMPLFKNSLSDTDRWNLVNFIRTLAPK
jgi:copper transport protein